MGDITLNNVSSGYNLSKINDNFSILEDIINDTVLHLSGGNNVMQQQLDMNSQRIINLPTPIYDTDVVRLKELNAAVTSGTGVAPVDQARQTGTGSQTQFDTPAVGIVANPTSMFVRIDGVVQRAVTDYNTTTAGKIDFSVAPALNADIDITYFPIRLTTEFGDVSASSCLATGSTAQRSMGDRMADVVNIKDWGCVGDYSTDDTARFKAAVAYVAANGGILYIPKGVYKLSESIDIPDRMIVMGDGAPQIATFNQAGGDKDLLRPTYKHLISGSVLIFTGQDSTYTTNRVDRFASLTYCMKFDGADSAMKIRDVGIILDVDVRDAGGTLTPAASDNSATVDVGVIMGSTQGQMKDVCIFGYFQEAGLVIHNDLGTTQVDTDYNNFEGCTISGGTAIIGDDSAIAEGLTGTRFINCGLYAKDHHTRADGDYTVPVLYIDGDLTTTNDIRGHSFLGCNLRTYANEAVALDHCDDIAFIGCTMEFSTLGGVSGADAEGYFTGTADTGNIRMFANAATGGFSMDTFVDSIKGNFQILGSGAFDHAMFGVGGANHGGKAQGVRISGNGGDSIVQWTNDFTSNVQGWVMQRDESLGEVLNFKFDNTTRLSVDAAGGLRNGGMGMAKTNLEIASGEITLGTYNYINVDVEGGAASTDDLETITKAGAYDGEIVVLKAANSARTVVCKDGSGNLRLNGDMTLDNAQDRIMLMYDGTNWCELSRGENSA